MMLLLALLASAAPTTTTLPNGLRVVVEEDYASPRFGLAVAYGAGSLDDPTERGELAHVTEHVTFRVLDPHLDATAARAPELNGFTAPDRTVYHVVDDARWLSFWLWIEAQRMAPLAASASDVEKEVAIVGHELELRNDLHGRLRTAIDARLFPTGARRIEHRPRTEQLERLDLDDVLWFHRTYYRPDNAVLAVVAPLPSETVLKMVAQHFGGLQAAEAPARGPIPVRACRGGRIGMKGLNTSERVYVTWRLDDAIDEPRAAQLSWLLVRRLERILRPAGLARLVWPNPAWDRRRGARVGIVASPANGVRVPALVAAIAEALPKVTGTKVAPTEAEPSADAVEARRLFDRTDRTARVVALTAPAPTPDPSPRSLDAALDALRGATQVIGSFEFVDGDAKLAGDPACE